MRVPVRTRRRTRSSERGSIFIEMLLVIPTLAFLLLLVMWAAHYNGERGQRQAWVTRCAIAVATATCGAALPAACRDVDVDEVEYGIGADAADMALGGTDLDVSYDGEIKRPPPLGSPAPYRSRARSICARPAGGFDTVSVVLSIAGI